MKLREQLVKSGESIPIGSVLSMNNRGSIVANGPKYKDNIGIAGEDLHGEYIELANNGTWVNSDYRDYREKEMMSIDDYTEKMIREYEESRMQAACSYTKSVPSPRFTLREAFIAGAKWQVKMSKGEPEKPTEMPDLQEYLNRGDR